MHPTNTHDLAAVDAAPHDGEKLKQFLKDNNIKIDDFAQYYLNKSRPVAYALLRKDRFTRDEVALVSYVFGLAPGYFMGDADAPPILNDYNKQIFQSDGKLEDFIAYTDYEAKSKSPRKFIEDYFARLQHYISLAQTSLKVYRYFGKQYAEFPEYVREQYTPLYKVCEQQMHANPTLRYERFCALPFNKLIDADSTKSDFEQTVQDLLAEMLPETVEHLARCLREFEGRFHLYAIRVPMRLHSFTLIDRQYALSEYDRIDRHGKVSHDMLFVDRAGDNTDDDTPIRRVVDVYHLDLNNLARETGRGEQRTVTLEMMLEAATYALSTKQARNKERKEDYYESKTDLNKRSADQEPALDKERGRLSNLGLEISLTEKEIESWRLKKEIIREFS